MSDWIDIKSMTGDELRARIVSLGYPAWRAGQIRDWLDAGVTDFSRMTNLPAPLRQTLDREFVIRHVNIVRKLASARDDTVKYLYALRDGHTVESVLMRYKHGWSQCLSTQVGCKMGCAFCATGRDSFVRDLLPSEMTAQIEAAQTDQSANGQPLRVSSVVLMGMGEPLDNFDNVTRFLEKLAAPGGVHIGMRHVSLSTCGHADGIRRLMTYKWQLTLSVSLHAPNDAIRARLMPVARRWPLEELLAVCRQYAEVTGRRISFEYAMIDGVNDSGDNARELAARLRGMLCHVNLIPLNPVDGQPFRRSPAARVQAFQSELERGGVNVTVRRTLGGDINGSCGQLRQAQAACEQE